MSYLLKIENLSHNYDQNRVFQNLSLEIQSGFLLSVLGESGCGKSTFLRDIAGLLDPQSGEIYIQNDCVFSHSQGINLSPYQRGVGLVFQDYALFPALTVSQNIVFGLHDIEAKEKNRRLEELLEGMGIGDIRDRFPHEISGGQQQRVALARSLAPHPKLILLDEPFANLDGPRTKKLFLDIKAMLSHLHSSAILVTHDQQDALTFSDGIAILEKKDIDSPASFTQIDTPEQIYHQPKTPKIAYMFGLCNEIQGNIEDGCLITVFGKFDISGQSTLNPNAHILIREEDVTICSTQEPSGIEYVDRYFLGSSYRIVCRHIQSGQSIIGHSKTPIETKHVHIKFQNNKPLLMV